MPRVLLLVGVMLVAGTDSVPAKADDSLKPFTTDGCSAFPNGLPNHRELWLRCCTEHDRAYWLGGTYSERRTADKQLHRCVSEAGEPAVAEIMLRGVRVGGSPWWPTSFRWGYGWPYGRGYAPVTPEERALAEKLLGTPQLPIQPSKDD